MRMRKPVSVAADPDRTDRSIELVCLALVVAMVTLALRIVSVV